MRAVLKSAGLTLAAIVLVAGCATKTSETNPATSETVTTPPATATSAAPEPVGVVIPVKINAGAVTPTNAEFSAAVGEPITVVVDSDVADSLHVHSVPEHEFEIKPAKGQSFSFAVTVPGQVVIELHNADKTVATLTVR
ncbi:MAG: hypothetical protein ACR2JM_02810 [Mycobacterium sp.]